TLRMFGDGEEERDHIFVDDVGRLAAALLRARATGVLNVVTGEARSFAEVAKAVRDLVPYDVTINNAPTTGPITHRRYDTSRLREGVPPARLPPRGAGHRRGRCRRLAVRDRARDGRRAAVLRGRHRGRAAVSGRRLRPRRLDQHRAQPRAAPLPDGHPRDGARGPGRQISTGRLLPHRRGAREVRALAADGGDALRSRGLAGRAPRGRLHRRLPLDDHGVSTLTPRVDDVLACPRCHAAFR